MQLNLARQPSLLPQQQQGEEKKNPRQISSSVVKDTSPGADTRLRIVKNT